MRHTIRQGMGKGRGSGYKNLIKGHDSKVHHDAGLGIKQPQRVGLSIALPQKNLMAKMRTKENPYEIWKSPDGTWEWRVMKKYQADDNKPYAIWFCAVKSPATFGGYDIGDVYVKDIKAFATPTKVTKEEIEDKEKRMQTIAKGSPEKRQEAIQQGKLNDFARDSDGKISRTVLSEYGKQQLLLIQGTQLHFSDAPTVTVKGDKMVLPDGSVFDTIDSDLKVNKIIFRTM